MSLLVAVGVARTRYLGRNAAGVAGARGGGRGDGCLTTKRKMEEEEEKEVVVVGKKTTTTLLSLCTRDAKASCWC